MNDDLKRFYEEQDRGCEEFFGMKPGTINLYLAAGRSKSEPTSTNKYKKYADVYHALFPKSNFYSLGTDRQREYIKSLKDIV